MIETIAAYAVVLAAVYFGLATMASGLVALPFLRIQGRIRPAGTGPSYVIPVCVNVLMWLGIAALWTLVLGGPMPLLLFVAVFAVYGLTAKDENLTEGGFMLAGAEQWSIVLAAIAHAAIVGIRWF